MARCCESSRRISSLKLLLRQAERHDGLLRGDHNMLLPVLAKPGDGIGETVRGQPGLPQQLPGFRLISVEALIVGSTDNNRPLAVATETPMLYEPFFIAPIFSSDSTRPNGIRHATSPVSTLMANNSPRR
jgi:hypothetical protein